MKKITYLKFLFLLFALIVGSSSVWAQSDFSTEYESSGVTYTKNCKVKIGDNSFDGNKSGTSSSAGSMKITVPSGTKYLHMHVSGWNGETVTLGISPTTYSSTTSISLTANSGISGSSPYTFSGEANTSNYYKVITFTNALTANTTLTFSATSGKRFVIWGVNTEEESTDEATSVTIDASGITNTDIASGTAAGTLAAVVKNSSSETIDGATVTWSSSKPAVATIDATTGAVTLVKRGTTTITASYAGVSGTYQSSNDTYVLTVTNSAANDGTAAHPFTPTEARDALDNGEIESETEYYVRGIIAKKNNISSGSLTYWLSDDGSMTNNVQCYKGKYIDGANFTEATDLEVGDFATVKGKLKIFSTTTYELDENNEVVSITPRTKVNIATFTATTPTIVIGETTETTVTNDQPECSSVSYTYESDDEEVATVDANGVVTAVAKGTANITVTPVISATDPTYKVGESKSIEITVTKPFHNVTFSVNGVASNPTSTEEDADIEFPEDPASVGGKAFAGWTTTQISGTTDEAPSLVSDATMGTTDITYYAVFAKATGGIVTKTDNLTTSTFGSPSIYSNWSNKKATGGSDAVYAGNSTTYSSTVIQIRSKDNSGIVSTTSGGKVKKVTVTWNTSTSADRTLDIYGKNTDYSSASDLYSAQPTTQGTKLGSIEYQTSNGTTTELTITDDYEFIGMRSNSGAMYINKISIEWETDGTTYSEYCTSVTIPASISAAGYATFSSSYDTDFSTYDALKVYYINSTSGNKATMAEIESKKVPANTGVIIKGNEGSYNAACIASAPALEGTNLLFACIDGYTATYDNEIYILADGSNGIGFYPIEANTTLGAGKAFIGGGDVNAKYLNLSFEGETTGIDSLNIDHLPLTIDAPMYNLAGLRVTKNYKGVVIVNGKKMLNK